MFNTHSFIKDKAAIFTALSDKIWDVPEVYFEEKYAVTTMEEALLSEGFSVTKNVAGLETAILGEFGTGPTIIAFLGEYDALSQLSQVNGVTAYAPIEKEGNGHGCGHNLLGVGSFAAACALKEYIPETGAPITVRYYGCPAEETGSGKAIMTKAGVFDDVDLAISWHPNTANAVMNIATLANYAVDFKFYGKSSHAAAAPHLGRSALDAVELMNVGVNFLREHVESDVRMHYAITNSGGMSANVVQPYAEVSYLIRAPKKAQVMDVFKRVEKIAEGAALMTETTMSYEFKGAASNLIPNTVLANVMQEQLNTLTPLEYSEEEYEYAAAIYETFDEQTQAEATALFPKTLLTLLGDKKINHFPIPLLPESTMMASTDVGDVSWKVPTIQVATSCWTIGTPTHTWQVVSHGKTSIGHKGMLYAAELMANTAIHAAEHPAVIQAAKNELTERLNGETYVSLIPEERGM